MPTILRIVLIVLCVIALYYLVVTLARSVSEQETGSLGATGSHLAVRGEVGETPAIGAHA